MIRGLSISKLLSTTIVKLTSGMMSSDFSFEKKVLAGRRGVSSVEEGIHELIRTLERPNLTHERRMLCLNEFTQLLKTLDMESSIPIIKTILRVDPVLSAELLVDPFIKKRIEHLYRVAGIAAIIAPKNIKSVKSGIDSVKKRIFEISSGS